MITEVLKKRYKSQKKGKIKRRSPHSAPLEVQDRNFLRFSLGTTQCHSTHNKSFKPDQCNPGLTMAHYGYTLGTLWEHLESTQRSFKEHSDITQRLNCMSERTHSHRMQFSFCWRNICLIKGICWVLYIYRQHQMKKTNISLTPKWHLKYGMKIPKLQIFVNLILLPRNSWLDWIESRWSLFGWWKSMTENTNH